VLAHGTGALNIDGSRIDTPMRADHGISGDEPSVPGASTYGEWGRVSFTQHQAGRWPANLLLDEEAAALLDAQSGERIVNMPSRRGAGGQNGRYGALGQQARDEMPLYADSGGASRFFYTAKASRSEREAGLEHLLPPGKRRANQHPTVKPVDLMAWLVRLVTPTGGLVLDPFLGSGSTGMAALDEGMRFVGFDLDPDYVALAGNRIAHRHVLMAAPPPESAGTAQPRLL
jgi:site-specific DNA-methyltransferase (adenine-specific)